MIKRIEEYSSMIDRLFYNPDKRVRSVTIQVTDACNLCCKYCYQHNKGKHFVDFETAKKYIDLILDGNNPYINMDNSCGMTLEFIGGEPLLAIDLMDQITEYTLNRLIKEQHPWLTRFRISICTNGVLYFDERVQAYLKKYKEFISFTVSIDGNKELHDSCRVFPDGKGSYDMAIAAAKHYMENYYKISTKMTLAPGNVAHTKAAIENLINIGYDQIHCNCVYEDGWTLEHARILYSQLKELADYLFDSGKYDDIYISIFEEDQFKPMGLDDDRNWCWGAGTPILTTEGYKLIEEINIGDKVYTEDGSIHEVINTTSHFADNCVKLHVSGAFDMVCTKNHQLFTIPFDYIGNKYVKHYKEYCKCAVDDIKHKDLLKLFSLPIGTINYNKDIAYLVGRYIGDGWDHYKGKGHSICCSFDEAEELKIFFNNAMVDYGVHQNKTVTQFSIYLSDNVVNNELHRILSLCGHTASKKHFPPECFNWNIESLKALMQGYFDVDGSINKYGQKRISTVSWQLAQETMVILRTLGYTPTCHKNKRNGESIILGRKVNIKDKYEIYFYEDISRSEYVHKRDGEMWTYGLKMTDANPQMVYNITVDTNHSYVAGGIVSANCGGNGDMIAVDYKGDIFPCLRYMESSLGDNVEPIIIGNVNDGIEVTPKQRQWVKCLKCMTRTSQSTDECIYCPIAQGCNWCSALNYEVYGELNKRATFICVMHKARALANVYFWNKYYRLMNMDKRMECHVPKEWALDIISEDEYNYLLSLAED